MPLWIDFFQILTALRFAFPRSTSYLWFTCAVTGFLLRSDNLGVTSLVRGLGLRRWGYACLLKHFERVPVNLDSLAWLWTRTILNLLESDLYRLKGRLVLIGDSTKAHKRGRRMPGVKRLTSGSRKSTEPEYIDGHHVHFLGLLAGNQGPSFCVPLIGRWCEGVRGSPSDSTTTHERMLRAQCKVGTLGPTYAVFDRYYGSGHFISSLLQKETQVIVRLRGNSVARLPAAKNSKGQRAKYGNAIGATTLALDYPHRWVADPFDSSEQVHVSTFVAYWRPLRRMVRWVVGRSSRYKQPLVLTCTDLDLTALRKTESLSIAGEPLLKFQLLGGHPQFK